MLFLSSWVCAVDNRPDLPDFEGPFRCGISRMQSSQFFSRNEMHIVARSCLLRSRSSQWLYQSLVATSRDFCGRIEIWSAAVRENLLSSVCVVSFRSHNLSAAKLTPQQVPVELCHEWAADRKKSLRPGILYFNLSFSPPRLASTMAAFLTAHTVPSEEW